MDERNDNYVRTPEEDYQDNWADLFIGGNENEASEEEHLITGQSISQHHKHNILKTAHLTFLSFGLVSKQLRYNVLIVNVIYVIIFA